MIETRLQNQRTSLAKGAVTTTLKDGTTLPYYKVSDLVKAILGDVVLAT